MYFRLILIIQLAISINVLAQSSTDNELIQLMEQQLKLERDDVPKNEVYKTRQNAYREIKVVDKISMNDSDLQDDFSGEIDHALNDQQENYIGVRSHKDRHYGSSRLRLGASKPDFNDSITSKVLDEYYKDEAWYPTVGYDVMPINGWFGLGASLRLGIYSDSGSAIKEVNGVNVVDKNSETKLMLVPIQGLLLGSYNPFHKKWLGIDVWGGYEYLYKRETLSTDSDAETALNSTSSKHLYVVGGSLNLILNWIEPSAVNSMRSTLGFGSLYLSGYYEMSKTFKGEGYDLSRTTIGFQLVFEKAI